MKALSLEEIKKMSVPDFTDRLFHTAREYHRMREALRGVLEGVWHIDEATVPKAGIEAAPGQVVFEGSVGYLKIKAAREALKESEGA